MIIFIYRKFKIVYECQGTMIVKLEIGAFPSGKGIKHTNMLPKDFLLENKYFSFLISKTFL